MKRIGIVTIPDYNNYGNRLQNFAVKCYFEDRGFCVNTIELNDESFSHRKERKYKLILRKYHLSFVLYFFEYLRGGLSKANRYMHFEKFTEDYLSTVYSPDWKKTVNEKIGSKYDYVVLGSDQIWHPYVNKTPNIFFGLFVPTEKRLFFSPSFGVDSISEDYCKIVKNSLDGVKKISVREETGKDILKNLTDADIDVLCDPTLVVEKEQWANIAKRPKGIPDEYVLTYFLGPVCDEYKELISKVQKEARCQQYCLADKKQKQSYATGPSEFIYSIMNSKVVVTDSFHAVVFSIIFSKPFVVCSRLKDDGTFAGLDSRIDVLLKIFALTDRKYYKEISIPSICNALEDKTDVLKQLKNQVDKFFDNILL